MGCTTTLTSCSYAAYNVEAMDLPEDDPVAKNAYEFIVSRTISIVGKQGNQGVFGTA
jgi:hypothetical protein